MGRRLPERAAFFLSLLAFCLAAVIGLCVGVPLTSAGLRAVLAACVFGVVGYSFGRALVNVIGADLLQRLDQSPSTATIKGATQGAAEGETRT